MDSQSLWSFIANKVVESTYMFALSLPFRWGVCPVECQGVMVWSYSYANQAGKLTHSKRHEQVSVSGAEGILATNKVGMEENH